MSELIGFDLQLQADTGLQQSVRIVQFDTNHTTCSQIPKTLQSY
jgi:hypothetical protein